MQRSSATVDPSPRRTSPNGRSSRSTSAVGRVSGTSGQRAARLNAVVVAECDTPQYTSWLQTLPDPEEKLKEITGRIPLGNRMTTAAEIADMTVASTPYKVMPERQRSLFAEIRERDREFYQRLEKVGFMLDFGEDDTGLHTKYIRRGSGYYIDVGASELVANGSIKLKSRVSVERITERTVVLIDGTELPLR